MKNEVLSSALGRHVEEFTKELSPAMYEVGNVVAAVVVTFFCFVNPVGIYKPFMLHLDTENEHGVPQHVELNGTAVQSFSYLLEDMDLS